MQIFVSPDGLKSDKAKEKIIKKIEKVCKR